MKERSFVLTAKNSTGEPQPVEISSNPLSHHYNFMEKQHPWLTDKLLSNWH